MNIRGVLNGIAAALPVMQAQGSGHIVNIASVGAHEVGSDGRCLLRDEARGVGDLRGLRQESSGDMRVTVVFIGGTVDDPRAGVGWLAQAREQASI